eukprot:108844_1
MPGINPSETVVKAETPPGPSEIHPRTFNLSAAFKCEFCDEEFSLKRNLIRHVNDAHQSSINAMKCEKIPGSNQCDTSSPQIQNICMNNQRISSQDSDEYKNDTVDLQKG